MWKLKSSFYEILTWFSHLQAWNIKCIPPIICVKLRCKFIYFCITIISLFCIYFVVYIFVGFVTETEPFTTEPRFFKPKPKPNPNRRLRFSILKTGDIWLRFRFYLKTGPNRPMLSPTSNIPHHLLNLLWLLVFLISARVSVLHKMKWSCTAFFFMSTNRSRLRRVLKSFLINKLIITYILRVLISLLRILFLIYNFVGITHIN